MPAEDVQANQPSNPRDEFARSLIGRVIDDFEIRREIGRGGMGVVFEACQRSLQRVVAVKVLTAPIGLTGTAIQRFQREAQAAAKLHHVNIVRIYAQGQAEGTYYYAMELIEGRSIHEIIEEARSGSDGSALGVTETRGQNGSQGALTDSASTSWAKPSSQVPRPTTDSSGPHVLSGDDVGSSTAIDDLDNIARLTAAVADALEYAHQAGVIHRDIKPHNLILGNDGRLCISDFGLARVREQPGVTMTGEFLGSPLYMSPEQLGGAAATVDHRTDIYSLGVTLYEWLTLRPPFPGQRRDQVVNQILTAEPTSPRSINPAVPVDLDTICLKAIERTPKRRYQSAAEMAADLRAYLQRREIKARRAGPAARLGRFMQRHQVAVLAACLVIVCGLFAVSMYHERQSSSRPQRPTPVQPAESLERQAEVRTPAPPGAEPIVRGPDVPDSIGGTEQPRVRSAAGPTDWANALTLGQGYGDRLRRALLAGTEASDGSLADQFDAFERYVAGELAQALASLHAVVMEARLDQPDQTAADDAYFQAVSATDDQTALSLLDGALVKDPDHYFARHLRAVVLCRQYRFAEMAQEARRLVEHQPDEARSHLILGTSLLLAGDADQALQELDRTSDLLDGRDTPWLLTLRGLCHARRGRFDQALMVYNQAIALDPNHSVALFARGRAQAYLGGHEAALMDADTVVQLLPDSAEAFTFRGECYDNLGQYDNAHRDYAKAIELGGDRIRLMSQQLLAALNAEQQKEGLRRAEADALAPPDAEEKPSPEPSRDTGDLSAIERYLRELTGGGQPAKRPRPDEDELPVP